MTEEVFINVEDIDIVDIEINEKGELVAKVKQKDIENTKINIINHFCTKFNNILNVYIFVKMENNHKTMHYIVLCSLEINKEKIIGNVDYFDSNENYDLLKNNLDKTLYTFSENEKDFYGLNDSDNVILDSVFPNAKEYIENQLFDKFASI